MPRLPLRAVILRLLTAAFFASLVGASCGQRALGVMPGVITVIGLLPWTFGG